MYRLLLDSCDTDLNIGISLDDKLIYSYSTYAWQRQSELMIPEIDKALKETKLSLKDIDNIVLTIGPGSYTGVRIALTIAKTLNVVENKPLIALSSLQVMGKANESYIALINARSKRSYIGIYSNGKCLVEDQVIENDKINDFVAPYLQKGFVFKGNCSYLGKSDDKSILEGLLTHSLNAKAVENPKALTPCYLKD